MNTQTALKSYAKVQYRSDVEVASPHKLIEMLYSGAVDRLTQAKGAMTRGDIQLKGSKINSAISIVGGLRESLSDDYGGDLVMNLDSLYVYIQRILSSAHANNDMVKLEEAITLLSDLGDTWREIA